METAELTMFLSEYGRFLESDGRHALWIGCPDGEGTIVYDQHNILYAYGLLDAYERALDRRGLRRAPVSIPVPHTHYYHTENDTTEVQLLSQWDWIYSPLRDGDDY